VKGQCNVTRFHGDKFTPSPLKFQGIYSKINIMLRTLTLSFFRNFQTLTLDFSDKINLLVGPNGSGKTNILEAIGYLSQGKSFRKASDRDLVNFQSNFFRIAGTVEKNGVKYEVVVLYDSTTGFKKILLNNKEVDRISTLFYLLPTLISTDRDQDIIDGPPAERRTLINRLISIVSQEYLQLLLGYKKVVENKNILLKEERISELEPWNENLEKLALRIVAFRRNFFEKVNPVFNEKSAEFLKGKKATIRYEPAFDGSKKLSDLLKVELQYGHSIFGPHRDIIEFLIDGKPAKIFASEGEKRLMILAFYFAFLELYKPESVVVLDEPFSVLDNRGTKVVTESLKNQTVISAPYKIEDLNGVNLISL